MYFEKSCKINNNGKVSGFHKRGKVENGNVTYFINDRFGDEEDIQRLEQTSNKDSLQHMYNIGEEEDFGKGVLMRKDLFDDYYFNRIPVTPFDFVRKHLGGSPTYLNPKYFMIPDHRRIKDDNEFIDYCEKQTKDTYYQRKHTALKEHIRERINNELDIKGYAPQDMLDDFKFTVENERNIGDRATEEQIQHWKELDQKYFPTPEQHSNDATLE